jgi:predicted nuclease of predicted toxin-antitoxin system
MKVLLDQNIDHRLAGYLRSLEHDVTAIAYDYPHGLSDAEVLAIAVKEHRKLITYDRADFGELIFRYDHPHCGVIVLRLLTPQDVLIENQKQRLHYVLTTYPEHLHHFLVVTAKKVRIRKTSLKQAA